MTNTAMDGRRGSKTILALCAAAATLGVAYATNTPGCLHERYLALRLIGHDTEVRCHDDDRSVGTTTPGGTTRASKVPEGWIVSTPTRSYRVPDSDGVIAMFDGDLPAGAVAFRPDPDVGP